MSVLPIILMSSFKYPNSAAPNMFDILDSESINSPSVLSSHPCIFTISSLHLGPNRRNAHTTEPLASAHTPNPVNSQPFPMVSMRGLATMPPTQLNMFLTKLFNATPLLLFFGMNSVNMVVLQLKMTILPMPKKKFATAAIIQCCP